MMEQVARVMKPLPPLQSRKNPWLACFGYDARRLCATEVWKEGYIGHLDWLEVHRNQPRTEAKWKEKSHLLPALRAA